jgi:hypothetical protein
MTITIPIRTVSELNQREHWRMRHRRRKSQRIAVWAHVFKVVGDAGLTLDHLLPCVITLTRVAPQRMDSDGVVASMKAVRDGVADALGVGRGKPREYAVEITIEARKGATG